jgi:hypothetical protein
MTPMRLSGAIDLRLPDAHKMEQADAHVPRAATPVFSWLYSMMSCPKEMAASTLPRGESNTIAASGRPPMLNRYGTDYRSSPAVAACFGRLFHWLYLTSTALASNAPFAPASPA